MQSFVHFAVVSRPQGDLGQELEGLGGYPDSILERRWRHFGTEGQLYGQKYDFRADLQCRSLSVCSRILTKNLCQSVKNLINLKFS